MPDSITHQFSLVNKSLKRAKNVLITSHENPDADAVGSLLALNSAFLKLNIKSVCYLSDQPSPSLNFLPHFFDIKNSLDSMNFDLLFCLDYGDFKRLKLPNSFHKKPMITFDHHRGEQEGFVKIIRPDFSSTAELIYYFLKEAKIEIDKPIATCLLAGIVSDTGIFSHISTSAQTMKVASDLLIKGAPLTKIIRQELIPRYGTLNNKIWGQVLSRVKFEKQKGLAYSSLTYENLKEQSINSLNLTGVASTISTIFPANLSLFLVEYEKGKIRGSLRSEPFRGKRVDSIARIMGGGGHPYAAGFKCDGTIEEVLKKVQNLII
ncbi:MAG TPA: bifunctional oligoribonuclease/PAP phosphatase NrnA [Candidatus Parcubacteria bacterium]|jgi:phosphoesterase RecJ-like protein|nr:bifunctional oligoribonuclease/PAP phosphatase NrnA [Candidatus Parcubacteria bacterium]